MRNSKQIVHTPVPRTVQFPTDLELLNGNLCGYTQGSDHCPRGVQEMLKQYQQLEFLLRAKLGLETFVEERVVASGVRTYETGCWWS